MHSKQRPIELLAPAKNEEIGIEAIKHGADAVYIGASAFGARSQAGNDIQSIKRLVDFAHQYDARIYCTVNTIVYDHELKAVEAMIHDLYNAGVDALIVQDMALLRLDLPPIALHASTQCDVRTVEKAQFLEKMGFAQLVLARELSLEEIKSISTNVKVPLEGFCHGALCVSYSGRCQISEALKHRSANRGECAQFCRLS
ncbi:MAG: U32 family peptidase, partial [Muribaculaceae bacterium]|nr:U32 family peptidase [Muribaculaceae bacterium]